MNLNKKDLTMGLVILLDLPNSDKAELNKLPSETLQRIYEGQKKNALAYQEVVRESSLPYKIS